MINALTSVLISICVCGQVIEYTRANREVAILCNHQRTVPKGFQESFDKMNSKVRACHHLFWGNSNRFCILPAQIEQLKSQLSELQRMKADVAKGKAIALKEGAAETAEGKAAEAHLFPKQPTADQVETRIKSWNKKVRDLETQIKLKDDNKTVALGTAKINYMDPRITVAWCKKVCVFVCVLRVCL